MLLTIKMILDQHLLDDYMPSSTNPNTKRQQIYKWIAEGRLLVAQGGKYKTRLIPTEAIKKFKDDVAMVIENIIK